jgi:hypothetical protein
MKTISVIKTTGNAQGDLVLAGVYGSIEPPAAGQPIARMRVASDFRSVSHLFDYLEHGMAPITEGSTLQIEVDDNMEVPIKAQLMHSLGVRWSGMYSNMLGANQVPSIMQTMLQGESKQVAAGVKAHLEEIRMRAWLVPFTADITSYLDFSEQAQAGGTAQPTERDLMRVLRRVMPSKITVDADTPPADLGVEMLGRGFEVAASDAQPEPRGDGAAPQQVPEWARWQRIAASIKGGFIVVANDARQAIDIAHWMAEQHNRPESSMRLKEFSIESVTAMREVPATEFDIDDDDHDDGDANDDLGDTDRDRG